MKIRDNGKKRAEIAREYAMHTSWYLCFAVLAN